jgi:transposase
MREKSVTEQRYDAVLGVISEGRTVMEVASQWGVSRRTLHRWLARYEADGLEGLPDRSHRPERCPHQMPAEVEVLILELRRAHRYWGARRLALELARKNACVPATVGHLFRHKSSARGAFSKQLRARVAPWPPRLLPGQ